MKVVHPKTTVTCLRDYSFILAHCGREKVLWNYALFIYMSKWNIYWRNNYLYIRDAFVLYQQDFMLIPFELPFFKCDASFLIILCSPMFLPVEWPYLAFWHWSVHSILHSCITKGRTVCLETGEQYNLPLSFREIRRRIMRRLVRN